MTSHDDTADAPTESMPAVPLAAEDGSAGPAAAAAAAARRRRLERVRSGLRAGLASYRVRIVAWFVALLTIGTLATVAVVGQLIFQRIDDGIRADLVQEVDEFRALAAGNDPETGRPFGPDVARMFDVFLARNIPGPHEVLVTFVRGEVYARSAIAPYPIEQDPAFVGAVAGATDTVAGRMDSRVGTVEFLAVPVRFEGQTLGVFAAAGFPDLARAEQEDVILGALIVGIALLLIGSLLAWRLADRLLAPVSQTAATARAISETDLSQRVEVRGYDEVADLARTFNDMLDRLESAFAGQRRFLDDVGHELRTPLTIVRGHLELLDEGTPEERDKTRELVLDELDRMTRLVNELIMLAQAARPDFVNRVPTDAGLLVRQVHEKVAVLGERDWQLSVADGGEVDCDPQRITQALLQLAANAVRHTDPGTRVELGVEASESEARFWVADQGPGIPESEQAHIFERFYRGAGRARSAGIGLGLSIVRAIAEAHGGHVTLESHPGVGSRFTIVVPRRDVS